MSLVFERCIGILKAFLSSCSSGNIGGTLQPEIHGALDEEAMLTIKTGGHVRVYSINYREMCRFFIFILTHLLIRRSISNFLLILRPRFYHCGGQLRAAWDAWMWRQ